MREQKIIVDVDTNGEVKIEAQGFQDATCLKATEDLEKSLGVVTARTKKVEAFKQAATVGGLTVGNK